MNMDKIVGILAILYGSIAITVLTSFMVYNIINDSYLNISYIVLLLLNISFCIFTLPFYINDLIEEMNN